MQGPKCNIIFRKLKFIIVCVIEDSSLPIWGSFFQLFFFYPTEGWKRCKVEKRKDASKKLKFIAIIMTTKNKKCNAK